MHTFLVVFLTVFPFTLRSQIAQLQHIVDGGQKDYVNPWNVLLYSFIYHKIWSDLHPSYNERLTQRGGDGMQTIIIARLFIDHETFTELETIVG